MLATILTSTETFVIIATNLSSITPSITGIGLVVIPISTGIEFGLTVTNKVIYGIVMQKDNKYKKQ